MGHRVVVLVRRGADVRVAFKLLEQACFQRGGRQLYIDDVDQQQFLLACIVAAFVNAVAEEVARGNAQGFGDQQGERVIRMV